MGELKKWRDQNWVRINAEGDIVGKCGTSPDKRNPDRCLPESKARSLSKSERAATARKKKKEGKRAKRWWRTRRKLLLRCEMVALCVNRLLEGAALL